MRPKQQTMTWKKLLTTIMISCLIMLPISPTSIAEDILKDCVKVVKIQKKAIDSQKIVIKKQKELIIEQKKYLVKKEAEAATNKLISGILSFLSVLLVLL